MCAGSPRHLGKGALKPPPLHPPGNRPGTGVEPSPAGRSVSPLHDDQRASLPFGNLAYACSARTCTRAFAPWTTTQGRLRSPFGKPIDQRFGAGRASRARPCTRFGRKAMAGSGSENRQRQRSLKARFTAAEASLIEDQAARAGVTVGTCLVLQTRSP